MINFTFKKTGRLLFVLFLLSLFAYTTAPAQEERASPPETASGEAGDVGITIDYSSPAVKDREIWGSLVPYNEVWRTGANEATTIEFDKDVVIEGQPLAAGKYSLFTIPTESEWTVIFNKNPEQWGAFKYDESEDALRVKVKPEKSDEFYERMKFNIDDEGKVILAWENLKIPFNVEPASN